MRVIHHSIVLERKCCFDVEKFGFHRLTSIISLFIFSLVLSGIYNIFCVSSDTFAHTASITSSGAVTIDVSASGNQANLGTDNITVNSSCPLGYTVSIAGPADNTLYRNGDSNSNDTISASTGTTSNPVSILGNNLGTWGYSTANNTTISSNFIGLTNTQVPIKNSAGASASGGDSFSVYYGVSVTNNTASGIYTLSESSQGAGDDAIVYYLTPNVNCAGYIIRYNDNGANSNTTMGITHSVIEDDEVTLAASNYKRNGYGFAGWSTVQLNPDSNSFQTDLASAKAAGKVFGPNETITANAALLAQATTENNTQYITMYAIWVKPATNAYLQNWQGCNSMNTGDVIALTDQRDSQAYAVAKLADDNCWMIENLRLEATNSSDETKAQGFGGVFSGLATAETSNFSNSTTANSKYSTTNITGDNQGYRFPRYNNANTNSTVSSMDVVGSNVYTYGNYYTWAAAMANTNNYTSPTATIDGKTSEDAGTSLCPTGWRLPRGGNKSKESTNDFWALVVTGINNGTNPSNYSSNTAPYFTGDTEGINVSKAIRVYPNNFSLSGYISDSSIYSRGNNGRYWASTASSDSNSYLLALNASNVYPGTSVNNKFYGGSVRCMMDSGYTITINAGNGVTALTAAGWTGSGTGTISKTIREGETIDLSTIVPTYKTGYTGAGYSSTGNGSISGSTYTVGSGAGTITIGATGLNTPTCTIQGGDTKVYNYDSTTLTATSNASNYDTNGVNITYSFGYGSSASNTLGNFSTAQSGNTYTIAKSNANSGNGFYGTRYYGVKVTVTDKTDSSITATCTSGTGSNTGTTVANRTTVARFNARINFNANGGTLSGTSPVYVAYENSATYSSRTATTTRAIPSATPPTNSVFDGWWTDSTNGTQVIDRNGNIKTTISSWTDENGKWILTDTTDSTSVNALYAHYASTYTITINAGPGVSTLTASGWSGSGTGTISKSFEAGETIDLSTITPTYKTAYSGIAYTKASGSGSINNSTFTVGAGVATITIKATTIGQPTCTISGGDTKVYNYASTTLTAGDVSSDYDTSSTNITYSFGYNTSATNALGNFSTATTGNTYDVVKDAFYNTRYYGVKITVTDKTDSSITSTCTSGTGTGTGGRTTVYRYNSRVNFNANGGTMSGTSPVYVSYENAATYSGRTNTTAKAIPTITAPSGKRFNGWWTATSGGSQVIDAEGNKKNVSDWINGSGQWIRTTTNSSAVAADTLYAQYVNIYTITINAGPGVSALTASGWTGTGTGTLTKEFAEGETIDLSAITPTYKTGYSGAIYSSTGSGSISGSTYTAGSGTGTITIGAGLIPVTCGAVQGGDTKVYNYASTTLTATDVSSSYDTSSADITYSFGYASSATNALGNFSAAQSGSSYTIAKSNTNSGNGFYGTRYYGVTITVTDKTDNSITTTCTSGTGTTNRATVTRVNARINLNATANGGTLGGTNPVYVAYENSAIYSSRTATTTTSLPTVTPPSGKAFNGWWTTQTTGGAQVIDASGNINTTVANWTNEYGQWILTDTTDSASVNMLYARFVDTYTITINAGTGISSLTASGWTGTGTGTLTKEFAAGETIDLSTITVADKTGYTGSSYSKTSGSGTLSGSTFTVGSGSGTITIGATGLNTPVCTIKGGDTKVFNYASTIVTATDNSSNFDTSSVDIIYEFGYPNASGEPLANYSPGQTGLTYEIAKDAFYGTRYYGVRVTVTDKADDSITNSCSSATGSSSGNTVNNRTTVNRVNSRVNFNANGGTLSHSNPVYVAYDNSATYSSRTGTTARAIPTVTPASGKRFNGWWTAASNGTQVINESGNLVTSATNWVDGGKWIRTTTNTDAVAGDTLYAQYINVYTITINAGAGISSLTASGWTGTGTGTLTKEFAAGETIDLSAITPTRKTGYTGIGYTTSGSGSISGSTYTVGSGAGTITFKATGLNTPTCGISGGDTKVYNYAATTLTATNVSSSYDTSSANITYSFGYASSASNTLGNFSTAQAGNTYDVVKDAFYNTRYYGVRVTVTDKTDSSITSTCTSGTGTSNRATVVRVNSRINFVTSSGTISGTNPIYVAYDNSAVYNSRTAATAGSIPTVTPASGKRFNGWWTAASGGVQVIDESGNLVNSATNWLEDGKWVRTSTNSDAATTDNLYAQFIDLYTITINATSGISSLTASGWTGTGTGTLTKEFAAGETIDLSTITAANKIGYTGSTYSKTSGSGTLSGSTFTVGSGVGTITFKATGLNTPTCGISGGDTKVYNYAATTLTATNVSSSYDTSSANVTYSFGYATSTTGTLSGFSTAQAGNTYDVAKNAFYNTRYYGVRVTVTDKTDSSITSTCTSGTGTGTGGRTTVYRYNSRVNFNANGGTLSGTSPVYVAYDNSATYSSRTGTTAKAIPSVTPPAGKTFAGWWTAATNGTQVINESGNLVTSATNWVDGGKWIRTTTNTDAVAGDTLYAHFTDLYVVTISAGPGISSLTASDWTGSGTGTLTREFEAGQTIDLSTITVTDKTGYTGSSYSKTSGSGTLSGSTFTVGEGAATITFKATGLNTPVCTIQGGDTKVYNYAATTLTATSNASNFDTSSADITYSFGYATSTTATLGNFSTAQASNTYDVAKDAFYNVRYYGVKVTVTDKTDSSLTSACTSGTGSNTGTTVANRTTVSRYNSRINFNANGGTLSGTSPVYVAFENSATYSSRTATTTRAIPTVTAPAGKKFDGWYTTQSTGGYQVINASGSIVGPVDGWTNGNGQWILTSTTDNTTVNTLYARYVNTYTITINAGAGISTLTASGWTGTGTGTLTKEFAAGETIDLSTITAADKTGYTGSSYSKTSGSGTFSAPTFTVGSGAGTITFKATGLNTPTCTISGGDTKVYNYAATNLTATNVSSSYDTNSADITYSFGYNTSATGTLGNFSTAQAGNTYDVAKDAFYDTRYYGVKVTVTDKTDSSITSTCTSGTGATNRTAVYRYNSRVNFNANGGTLSHSNPVYVAYGKNQAYSSRTATTLRGIPDVTAPAGKKFNGWWTAASGGAQVIDPFWDFAASSIPDWVENGNWARTTTNANAVAGDTLYAQFINVYTITINAGAGISTLTASGWTGSGTGTLTKEFAAGETIDLSTITVADKTGYTGSSYSKTSGSGTLSGSTFTVGSGAGTITFKATGLNTPTCKMTGGDTQVYAYVPTTITATDNSSNYDSSSVDITYSFGYASSASGTLVDFSSTQDENTYNVTRGAFRGTRYYGVTVTVTDKTDSSITTTCTSGTGTATGSTVANRTTVTKVNARVNFNANGGSGGGYSYVSYTSANVYVSRTSGVVSSLPTVTPPSGNAFNGWWTDPTNGTQVIDKDGNIQSSVSGWTNASGQWILTNTTDNNSVNVLYAHYVPTHQIEIIPRVGIASISASGWTVTGTGSLVKEFVEGETIDLSTIIPTYKTGYSGVAYLKATGRGELNGSIFTVGNGLAAIEISATGINTPTCEIKGGDTKVYNYTDTKLTAMDVSSSYDTSSVSIVYEFGYATSLSGALANFTQSSSTPKNEFYVAKNAFRGERIYGVRVTVTDNTDSSITSTCTSTGGLVNSGDSYAARTIMRLYNARINFNPNGGTLSHSNPVYVSYEDSNTYSSRTGFSTRNIPTVTPPTGKVFAGWYLAPEQGQPKVIDDDGSMVTVSGWVNESGQWILTSTLDNSNANTLYAQYRDLPCGATGVICYDDNGANSSTTMGNQSVASSATSVNLWASNFQRSGYGFAGWNTEPDGSGTMYGPNATIDDETTLDIINNDSLKLYAMWVEPAKDSSNNVLTFQTNNLLTVTLNDNSTLDSKPVGYVTALKDARDNQVYAVAKYADGNYWMIENLRLEAAGTTGSTNQALSQGYGGVFTGLANAENANFAEVTTANSKYSTSNVTGDNQAYRIPRYNNVNTQSTVSEMTDPDQNVYSYGNYYNWPAATANTTNTLYPYDSESTGTSICPAGWRLPTGGEKEKIESSGSDYYNLSYILAGAAPTGFNSDNEWLYTDDNLAGEGSNLSKALRAYPYNFVYSGRFDGSSAHDRGLVNNYWSSTKHLSGSGHRFAFRDTYVFPATTENYTYRGDSVRCMAGQVLYNNVAKQSKGTQTSANLQANITKSNSGVYEYNSSVFGAATDAANNYKIYYYRGILDNTTGTYGSNGDGAAYPNYVRLGNTCWRIVRTTGSGGTKMIYNGNWTGSTCANATTSAQVSTSAFNGSDDTTSRQWVRVGYTYRSGYASTSTTSRTLGNTFGTNTSFANNSANSTIKSYIEGTWFTGANGVSAYQSILEPSAGYCNDRTVYSNTTPYTLQGDSVSVAQYATSATRYNFGALVRNVNTAQVPSLGCPRSTADLYTTSAASNGNKQLTRAAALLTADEASFAGSGNRIAAENGSDYDPNSFLNSGSEFILLSPYYRATTGIANVFEINTDGAMTYISTGTTTTGVRPVISLKPGTATAIGSGTATDPWIIKAP